MTITKNFPWGEIINVHSIGEYKIIEYRPRKVKDCIPTGELEDFTHFHIKPRSGGVSRSYLTLDEAIIGHLAHKYDGINTDADRLISQMLGMRAGDSR